MTASLKCRWAIKWDGPFWKVEPYKKQEELIDGFLIVEAELNLCEKGPWALSQKPLDLAY